ncbi:ABC transporter substrate-binding protein [Metabacillus halosaccharovorans]|uniref:ABC transporter substrate-binding protein n=1 Tax=Metabacillus halosaccharovorans TaxID=930124 RepID=UPI00203FE467|nr:ABC transporter substrate-binding protein [Metabacillus halosaccharovorans]MCM3439423.1 ABC transporter substrate-binding protein [Metabacillus halosaccharovorans]
MTKKKKQNKFFLLIILTLVISLIVGCTSNQTTSPDNNSSSSNGKTQFHLGETINPEQVSNFNPLLATGNWENLFEYIYEPLFYFNQVKGELISVLATDLGTWSEDQKSFTVSIQEGVKWHDGTDFTLEDILFTFNALKENKALDRYQIWGDKRLAEVVIEGNKVVFKLNDKFPSLPFYLSTVDIVPKHIFEKEDPGTFLNKQPIGTGPFTFKSVNESAIILEKNADHYSTVPKIDELVIQRYNNASTLTLALEKGEVQASTGTIAMPSIPKLLENSANKMQVYPGLSVYSVLMNNDKPGLEDIAVRKAIQLAIDRKTLIEKGEMDAVFPANPGFLPKVFGDMADDALFDSPDYSYNLNEATKILEEAGYKKNSDGIFEKNGKELSFVYNMASNAPAQNKEGTMITQWLQEVGIKTTVKLVTWPELTKLAMSGDYELLQNGITFPPDPQAALEVFHSSMTAPIGENTTGLNYMRFKDVDVDKWLDEAFVADPEKRKELYDKVQKRIADLAPMAVMYNVGGHVPYRVDTFTNYREDVPVFSALSLSQVELK